MIQAMVKSLAAQNLEAMESYKNKVVILGTAHGSNVPGKCSPDKKFREYKFSREVIKQLKPQLEALGLLVFVDTRCHAQATPNFLSVAGTSMEYAQSSARRTASM